MCNRTKLLLDVSKGNPVSCQPIWLMRQAGRYLPEYKALRAQAESFIDFCLTPNLAVEATLQPVRRFGVDGAILFADILLVPFALGQHVEFRTGEGPHLDPLTTEKDVDRLLWNPSIVLPVFETVQRVKENLNDQTALIGFAGSPWTVACYMIEGCGRPGFPSVMETIKNNIGRVDAVIEKLINATTAYLLHQIDSGAEIIQLFESHAGLLQGELFYHFVVDPTRKIVAAIKEAHPTVPVVGFPRGARIEDYARYANLTGVDVVGVDQNTHFDEAIKNMPGKVLQGNLDPTLLVQGGRVMTEEARALCGKLNKKHIFNLGHGVLPETPPEHVAELVRLIHSL